MLKRVLKILVVFAIVLSVVPEVQAAASNGVEVYIDGTPVEFNEQTGYPYLSNEGRTMVPLRVTMESFGAEVDWKDNTAIVRKGTTTVRCVIGESCIYRNDVRVINDAAAVVLNSRTYLPIRAVLEAFGAEVSWHGYVDVKSPGVGGLVYEIEHAPSVTTNYWGIWNDAIGQKNAGNYQGAIDTIKSISSVFIAENPGASSAMLYKHLGESYSNLKEYDKASACFTREAYHWGNAPGMEQCVIDANRRANLIKTATQVYVKNYDMSMGAKKYFGAPHEPQSGIYLGAYVEGDRVIYDPYNPAMFYMDTFPQLVGKEMAAYLLYVPYGQSISIYDSHIQKAKEKNKIIQIAFEPRNGLGEVNSNDGYLIDFAKELESYAGDCRMLVRFAGEMNDTTSKWYSEDPAVFIQKFRIVAGVLHRYAPSVPIIWAPNFFPSENMDEYYPGDEYVDYVGISSYQIYSTVTDPLGQGVDRSHWSNQLDYIYSHYGNKKPIIVVESGASCVDYDTLADVTDYAASQAEEFLKYLPIKYPNVKMYFIYDTDRERFKFALSTHQKYLEAFKDGISSDLYLTCPASSSNYTYDYYEIGNNVNVKAEKTELCSYVITPENNIAYVTYSLNGNHVGTAYGVPYSVDVDFTNHKGQMVDVTVSSFSAEHRLLTTYTVRINVV